MSSPRRGWGRLRIGALAVALAIFGGLALRAAILAGPALNGELRVAGPHGDWRVANGVALYYQNAYLREQAHGWLLLATEKRDETAAAAARDLLRQSLAIAPANAFAWTQLGWAELATRDVHAARAALFAAWRFGPFSKDLSASRLLLASSLALEKTPEAIEAIRTDLRVLRRNRPETFAAVLATRPRLRPLAEALDAPAGPGG